MFPRNGQPGATDSYDVLLDAIGSPYSIRFDSFSPSIAIDQLAIASRDAKLELNGNWFSLRAFNVAGGVTVSDGQFVLNNGDVATPSILGGNSGLVDVYNQSYFSQPTLVNLPIAVNPGATLYVDQSLTLDGNTVTLNGGTFGASLSSASQPYGAPTDLSLLGTGTVLMTGKSSITARSGSNLRIGSGVEVKSVGISNVEHLLVADQSFINEGTITADVQFSDIEIEAGTLNNVGLIEAKNSSDILIYLDENTMQPGSGLRGFQTSSGGAIRVFAGTIDNRANTLNIGGGNGRDVQIRNLPAVDHARIVGGTIGTSDTVLDLFRTELDAVTLAGTVTGSQNKISNGLTLDGGKVLLSGSGAVEFTGSQQVEGVGAIELVGGSFSSSNLLQIGVDQAGTVEFGQGVLLNVKSPQRSVIRVNDFLNRGRILFEGASLNGGLSSGISGRFVNRGTIRVSGGDPTLEGDGLDRPILNFADIIVDDGFALGITNGLHNFGTITLGNESKLHYFGDYTYQSLGNIVHQDADIELRGTLHLENQSLDFDDTFGVARTNLNFSSLPTIRNGRLSARQTGLLSFNDYLVLEDITLDTDTTFYGFGRGYVKGTTTISEGVNLYLGLIPDGVNSNHRAQLTVLGSEEATINGPGEIVVVGGAQDPRYIEISTRSTPLILGPGLTVRTDGGSFTLGATNRGLIQVNRPSDSLRLLGNTRGHALNEGVIEVNAGRLFIDDRTDIDSIGDVRIAPDASVFVVGDFDLLGKTLDLGGVYGGRWYLSGQKTHSEREGIIANGRIETNGTVLRNGDPGLGAFSGRGTLRDITLAGDVLVAGGQGLALEGGLTLDNGRIQLGEMGGRYGVSKGTVTAFNDVFHIQGTGEIVFSGGSHDNLFRIFSNGSSGAELAKIDSGITVRTDGGGGIFQNGAERLENSGTFSADGFTLDIFAPSSVFEFYNTGGLLEARNGGHLRINQFFGDVGTLQIVDGGQITLGGDLARSSTLGGDYRINEALTLGQDANLTIRGKAELASSLTIQTGARVSVGGDWTNSGTIDVQAGGALLIDSDWTNNGTIDLQPGGTLSLEQIPRSLGAMNLNGLVQITGHFTTPELALLPTANATVSLDRGGVIQNELRTLLLGGPIGTMQLNGGRIQGGTIDAINGETLVVASGFNQLIGLTSLLADIDVLEGGSLRLEDTTIESRLTLTPGSSLHITGSGWQNFGTIDLQESGVLLSGTSVTLGEFVLDRSTVRLAIAADSETLSASISGTQGVIEIASDGLDGRSGIDRGVDNVGKAITLDQSAINWVLGGGILRGGVVRAVSSESFVVNERGGLIEAVQFDTPLSIQSGANLTLSDNVVATQGVVIGQESIDDSNPAPAVVLLGEGQALGTLGEVVFSENSVTANSIRVAPSEPDASNPFPPAPVLEVAVDQEIAAVNGGGGTLGAFNQHVLNRGTLTANGVGSELRVVGSLISNSGGLFKATNGGTLSLQWLGGKLGAVQVDTGGTLVVDGFYEIDQAITLSEADLILQGTWSLAAPLQAANSTLGLHSLPTAGDHLLQLDNSEIQFFQSLAPSDLPTALLHNSNALALRGGSTLGLNGGDFDLATIEIVLDGGSLLDGNIEGAEHTALSVRSVGTLKDITLNAPLVVMSQAVLSVENNLTNFSTIEGQGVGGEISITSGVFVNDMSGHIAGNLQVDTRQGSFINKGAISTPGSFRAVGDFTQEDTGLFRIEITDDLQGNRVSGNLAVTGVANLAGTLELDLETVEPLQFMDQFDVLDLVDTTGWFDTVELPELSPHLHWDTSTLMIDGVVVVSSIMGDMNGDGVFDAADFVPVVSNFGQAAQPRNRLQGDLSGDGMVGIEDIDLLLAAWDPATPLPDDLFSSVPEPSTAAAFLLFMLLHTSRYNRKAAR